MSELAGAIAEAIHLRLLEPSTPGLAALAEKLRSRPRGFVVVNGNLEEARWPIRNDAALAYFAARSYPNLNERLAPRLEIVKEWLAGGPVQPAELRAAWNSADAIHWASTFSGLPFAEIRETFLRVHPSAPPEALEELERTLLDPIPDTNATELIALVVSTAYNASEGWLAYYAHRSLPSPTAVFAARAIALAATARGLDLWTDIVEEALRLPIDPAEKIR